MGRKAKKDQKHERYEMERSPLAQRPTQRDVAALFGETRDDLRRLINYKDRFVVRRQIATGKQEKLRDLAYPVNRLRRVHERLKFHLNKVVQPSYLFSPRRGRGQRHNASRHSEQRQYLSLDLKQFYPSTSAQMVKRWFRDRMGMNEDVAGLLTHLVTVDGVVSFGSPVTLVLCSLVHRPMFDGIASLCETRGLRYSVWVDDLTISGPFTPGELLKDIREIVRSFGLKSHKVKFRTGNRPVFITGIGVVGSNLVAPNTLHRRIKASWSEYHLAVSNDEKDAMCQRLLSQLGTLRHVVGPATEAGQRAADQMNSLRQQRGKRLRAAEEERRINREKSKILGSPNPPLEAVPF